MFKIIGTGLAMVMVAGLAGGGVASADEGGGAAAANDERRHSINLNPAGALVGEYAANYEYLMAGGLGLLGEGAFSHSSADGASVTEFGGAAGLRWHWRGRQNSGFIGAMVSFYNGTAEATVGSESPMTYDLTVRELAVTANVGKRWQLDNGLNITWRLGGGWARRWVSTTSTDPDAQDAVQTIEDLLAFLPVAVDGELSLGYSF